MKSLRKDLFREIKHSFGRFFAIFAIVLLGVSFFAGVSASPDNMRLTADTYFDDYRLQDIRLISSIGFKDFEIENIRNKEGVKGVYPAYTLDVLGKTEDSDSESVFSLTSIPTDLSDGNEAYINRLRLFEGRLPEKPSECVLRVTTSKTQPIPLGKKIEIRSGTGTKLSENMNVSELTVVGIAYTPYSISFDLGSSDIGNGKISYLAWVPDTAFTSEYYTNVFVTLAGAEAYDSFTDKYLDYVSTYKDELKDLGKESIAERIVGIKTEIHDTVTEEVTKEVTKQVTKEVEKAIREEIEKTVHEEVEKAVREAIEKATREEVENQVRLAISREVKSALEKAVREGIEAEVRTQVEASVEEGIKARVLSEVEAAVKAGIEARVKASVPDFLYEIALKKAMEENFRKTVDEEYPKALEKAMEENFRKTVDENYPAALQQAMDANFRKTVNEKFPEAYQKALDENYEETVEKEYPEALETAMEENFQKTVDEKFPDAFWDAMEENYQKTVDETVPEEVDKILPDEIEEVYEEQVEENLEGSEDWKWYVLDRESQASFMEYRAAAETMSKISIVFPLFFFFVAALVCFTTMARMVDEQRMLIGTYKALGYQKGSIALKYVLYALLASLSGGILGCFLGMRIFPSVIMNAWGIAYQMPQMLQADHTKIDVISVSSITLIVVLSALFACFRDLMAAPASLMRPKAPKHGKTVFLEKAGFIWNRLSFTGKVTVRNILRYRKRFIMTLAGVAGCTALLVTGFGISDSVNNLIGTQFGEIYRYDASVTLKSGISVSERKDVVEYLSGLPEFSDSLFVSAYSGKVNATEGTDDEDDLQVSLTVLPEDFSKFILLRDEKSKDELSLKGEGVIVAGMTAEEFDLHVGDSMIIENQDGIRKTAEISGIAEFYVGHSVFMNEACYQKLYGEPAEKNTWLALSDLNSEEIGPFSAELMEKEEISSVTFFNISVQNIRQMTAALSIITVVLIISSLLLSFVVLYNMTNVNISERIREIATIKVLGFYDNEVNAYVYRESIAITILGAALGLGVGVLLHHYIMDMINVDTVTFGNYISPRTYVYSFLLTIVFSIIVSIFISGKLKRVPMVESLKSVE